MSAEPIHLLFAGGTIAMSGAPARPSLEVVEELQTEVGERLETEVFKLAPSVQFSWTEGLGLCARAVEIARGGASVVVTHGTDLLEEVAFLCDLIYDGAAPIVFTGAMRIASAPGADGPANLRAAIAVASSEDARGLGAVVVFADTIHAARFVRKADSTGIDAFASPQIGPLGHVEELRTRILCRLDRHPPVTTGTSKPVVEILTPGLDSSPDLARAAADLCDGLIISTPGAGHTPPRFLDAVKNIAERLPVVAVARPWRGALLRETYGFDGAEVDLRASDIVCAGQLGAPAARIALMAELSRGPWDPVSTRELFTRYD